MFVWRVWVFASLCMYVHTYVAQRIAPAWFGKRAAMKLALSNAYTGLTYARVEVEWRGNMYCSVKTTQRVVNEVVTVGGESLQLL